jgi:transcriptional regulator GlxA family with amidase domain
MKNILSSLLFEFTPEKGIGGQANLQHTCYSVPKRCFYMHAWEQIQLTVDYIEEHLSEEIKIEDLAKLASLSQF